MLLTFIIAMLTALLVCGALFLVFFPKLVQTPMVFDDIIIETLARTGLNKAAELSLFWKLSILGLVIGGFVFFISYLLTKKKANSNTNDSLSAKSSRIPFPFPVYGLIFILPLLTHAIVFGQVQPILVIGLVYFLALWIVRQKKDFDFSLYLAFPVFVYYANIAVLTLLSYFINREIGSSLRIYFTTLITGLLIYLFAVVYKAKTTETIKRIVMALQCIIPLCLIVFLIDTYEYQGQMMKLRFAPLYYVFYLLLILLLCAYAIYKSGKNFSAVKDLSIARLSYVSTALTVFVYNSFSAAPLYAQPDQHHHGEQLIPWQQIVTLGQSAYKEYTPVSGLFPMVNGFIQNVLFRGTVSDYSPAISVTVTLFALITMYLIYRHVGGAYSLMFAIFFALPSYNRQYMVLPVLLLVFLPVFKDKPKGFFFTWILSCFLAGLYYPLYGAAVLVGTLPLGIYMFTLLLKLSDKKKLLINPYLYMLLGIIICYLPLLKNMAMHTLTYSGQTIQADGISIWGQDTPAFFMPYLSSQETIRSLIFLSYRFLLPMLGLWIFAFLLFAWMKKADRKMSSLALAMPAGMITLAVSYSYTLVRADVNMILSRTAPVLIATLGMFLPIILLSEIKDKRKSSAILMLILGICFSLPGMIYQKVSSMKFPDMWIYPNPDAGLVMDDADKVFHHYEVPDIMTRMDELNIPHADNLGNGFMVSDQIGYLEKYDAVMTKCEEALKKHSVDEALFDLCYMGFDGQGFYYYLNAKTCATGFIQAGKSYDAQMEILEQVKKRRPVIFLLEPMSSYYIYEYVLTHDYVYDEEDDALYPAELYAMLTDTVYTTEYISDSAVTNHGIINPHIAANGSTGSDYRAYHTELDFGQIAANFGQSFDSMNGILDTEKKIALDMSLDFSTEIISGTEYDAMYLELSNTDFEGKNLTLYFMPADSTDYGFNAFRVICQIKGQKLFLPLGMNPAWLLSDNIISAIEIGNDEEQYIYYDYEMCEWLSQNVSSLSFYNIKNATE